MRKLLMAWISIFLLVAASIANAQTDLIYRNGFESLSPGSLIPGTETPLRNSTVPADALPVISTRFTLIGSGAQVFKFEVDGTDVTKLAQLSSDRISYTPTVALTEGSHTVQVTIGTAPTAVVGSWTFKSATPPVIAEQSPFFTVIAPTQTFPISARYSDIGSGIDAASVRLDLDQVNVSAQATINASTISYTRVTPFSEGEHAVKLSVKDLAGNETVSSWSFTVGVSPELTQPEPANGALLPFNSRPLIKINYQSKGPALNSASMRFYFDAEDVTARATLTPTNAQSGSISFQPAQPLSSDSHAVYVELANSSGAFGFAEWSFSVDAERLYSVDIASPLAAATVLVPEVEVLAKVLSNRDFPRQVTINGLRGRYRSQVPGGVIYAATVPLVAGSNTVEASATFADGITRTATRTVTYDAPPVVTITSPRDWETFGLAASINGAPVSGNASNLTGLVDRPITITGTVSKAVTSVSINQQAATLSPDRKSFTFNNFFLREGTSLLSVNATDSFGRIGTANVTVFVDQTAPLLTIENPVNNAVTSSNRIDVRGIANDAVEGGLGAAEPVVTILNTANQQSITAVVSDRYYFATDIPLEVGANDLTITATDQRGNARTQSVRVVRIAVGSKRITLLGGNRQAAPVKSELPQALQISAIDAQGNPLANLAVRFDIVRGNGSISLQSGAPTKPNGVNPARNLVVNTDQTGVAKIWLTLGSESSPGGNSVRAWSPEIAEDTIFTATGERGAPYWVVIDGNASAQFVQTGTAPVDALQSAVYDQNYNRMVAKPVRYRILSGEALFTANSAQTGTVAADGQSITVLTDKDGRASVRPIAGENPGIVKIISEAVLPNNAVAGQALFQLSVLERKSGPTKFRGVVMNHTGKPLAGVRLSIARTNLSATSDSNGKFEFADQVPPGKIDLFVDGRTVTPTPNIEYPALHFETAIIPGQDNQLPHAIYLPPVNLSSSQIVGGNQDVTLTIPGYEGFELIVKANSVTFPDGSHTGALVVSPVHNDRLPMVPPGGAATFGTLGWTIQPTGTRFDPPAQVKIPNPGKMTAGQTASIVQWDHDLATFVPMGRGTVSEDASQIITDFGSGITKAGWGGCNGPGCPPDPGFPNDGDNSCPAPEAGRGSSSTLIATANGVSGLYEADFILNGSTINFAASVVGKCEEPAFAWDFGDGEVSTLQNPNHKYLVSGEYKATARAICRTCTPDPSDIQLNLKCKIGEEIIGRCVAKAGVEKTFSIETNDPDQTDWKMTDGTPPDATDKEVKTTFRTPTPNASYKTKVQAFCSAQPNNVVELDVSVAKSCSSYLPIVVDYPLPLANAGNAGPGNLAEHKTQPKVPKLKACVDVQRWDHRVAQVGVISAIVRGTGLPIDITSANSPLINQGNCPMVISDLTPVPSSSYGGVLAAPYSLYYSSSIVFAHEKKHQTDFRELVVNPFAELMQQWGVNLTDSECEVSPNSLIESMKTYALAEYTRLTTLVVITNENSWEQSAYPVEVPLLTALVSRIRQRARAHQVPQDCVPNDPRPDCTPWPTICQ